MGSMQAVAMNELLDLERAVGWHLQSNHYPPVPSYMVPVCIDAIEAVDAGNGEKPIQLPASVTWRDREWAPAWVIVEGHHLEAFLTFEEESYG